MKRFWKRLIAMICVASMMMGGAVSDMGAITVNASEIQESGYTEDDADTDAGVDETDISQEADGQDTDSEETTAPEGEAQEENAPAEAAPSEDTSNESASNEDASNEDAPSGNIPEAEKSTVDTKAVGAFDDYVIHETSGDVHFVGTAFGDFGASGNYSPGTNQILETDGDGRMRVAALNDKGKIASTSDGLAMYYYKIEAGKPFKLSAKATVNSISSNSQAAFGLMARDDIKDPGHDSGVNSNYVVAGSLGTGCNCFYRASASAISGKQALTKTAIAAGSTYNLSIEYTSGTEYKCTLGAEAVQTYSVSLNSADSQYVYVGMIAVRNADVRYSNIYLEVDGNLITGSDIPTEHKVTVTSNNSSYGTAMANVASAVTGDTVTLTATPKKGYIFKEWQVADNAVVINEQNQFTMGSADVSITAVFEKLYKMWDFSKDKTIAGGTLKNDDNTTETITAGISLEGISGRLAGLQINAETGKFDSTGSLTNGWAQVNTGTIITVPVEGKSWVTVNTYGTGDFKVDGSSVTTGQGIEQTFECGGTDNKVTIEAESDSYIRSIRITPYGSELAQSTNLRTATTADALAAVPGVVLTGVKIGNDHGPQTANDDATMLLNLHRRSNIVITTCGYGAGTDAKMKVADADGNSTEVPSVEVSEGAETGRKFTLANVPKGYVTITINRNVYIHSIELETVIVAGDRMIEVWDIGAKAESDTELYDNVITAQAWKDKIGAFSSDGVLSGKGNFGGAGSVSFGDFTITFDSGDRLYTSNTELEEKYSNSSSTGAASQTFSDNYTAGGGYYVSGTGGSTRRYLTVNNVDAGDKIIVYMGIHGKAKESATETNTSVTFEGQGQKDTVPIAVGDYKRMEFTAEHSGSYKIYEAGICKAIWHRVVRIPGVIVNGTIDYGTYQGTGHTVKFVNKDTQKETVATLGDNNSFSVILPAGHEYIAVLSGASGFGFTNDSKTVVTTNTEAVKGHTKQEELVVEVKQLYTYSGKITGFDANYTRLADLAVKLVPTREYSNYNTVTLSIPDKTNMNFTASLEPDVEYEIVLSGVNDYEVTGDKTIKNTQTFEKDITVALKPKYTVTGGLIDTQKKAVSGVTSLKFTALNETGSYVYSVNVSGSQYSIDLRDGEYKVEAVVTGYTTRTHVVVDGHAVEKDIMFKSGTTPTKTWVSDIYVGYPEKSDNYDTVTEAVAACAAMNPGSEDKRITVHIAPGTYREQLVITTPYISFVNDTDEEVLLTWYYGIGYSYYSASTNGFCDIEDAHDKYGKGIAKKWGTSVYLKNAAKAFRAEGITFENSFNRYITEEEIADGVELDPNRSSYSTIAINRNYNTDCDSKAATERAAAIVIESDEAEFKDCSFYSSQDTVYASDGKSYFKNCLIEGQTDYIFDDSANCVFDACELRFKGYSSGSQGGYITADRPGNGSKGLLFRNCTVTGNSKLTVTPGSFGRPWGADAKVVFMNTKLADNKLIIAAGWDDWDATATAANANFYEYNTTLMDGTAVSTVSRVGHVMTEGEAAGILPTAYFGAWTPKFYTEEDAQVTFTTKPFLTNNGDLNAPAPGNTLTVGYSLGAKNDANDVSRISWYRIKAGQENLITVSNATVGKSYKLTMDDAGCRIKVIVKPMVISGTTGTEEECTLTNAVGNDYYDPDTSDTDPTLGDGVNIFLIGDSTVKDYGSSSELGAWGEFLQGYFDKSKVTIANYANGGRSSRNFINEGTLKTVADNIKAGDYMLIQFGHNDCSDGADYIEDRYVPLGTPDANGVYPTTAGTKQPTPVSLAGKGYGDTCYTWNCGGTYKGYLKMYIDVAKEAGATPILVTPVARMYYTNGKIRPHHDAGGNADAGTTATSNNAYVTAVKQLADEQHVLLIDGFELTKDLFETAYADGGNDKYGTQLMATKTKDDGSIGVDSTHNNKLGGMVEAALIASAIQGMELNISKTVKVPAQVMGSTPAGKPVFSVNGSSEIEAYDITSGYTARAGYWEAYMTNSFKEIATKAAELNPGQNKDPEDENPEADDSGLTVTLDPKDIPEGGYVYTGSAITPAVIVKNNNIPLTEGTDYTVKYSNNKNASTTAKKAKITVTGKGSFSGKAEMTFDIEKKDIGAKDDDGNYDVIAGDIVIVNNTKATPILTYKGMKLTAKDFTSSETGKIKATGTTFPEEKTITLTGQGNYKGTQPVTVKIVENKNGLNKFRVSLTKNVSYVYNGNKHEVKLDVTDAKDSNKKLTKDTHYIVTYNTDCTNAGKVSFTVVGINGYTGSVSKSFKIQPNKNANISADFKDTTVTSYPYTPAGAVIGSNLKVVEKVGTVEKPLEAGKDYKITYSNNKKVPAGSKKAKCKVTFIGNYKGCAAKSLEFTVGKAVLSDDTVEVKSPDKAFKNEAVYQSKPYVYDKKTGAMLKTSDYTVKYYTKDTYADADEMSRTNKLKAAGTVYVKVTGKGNYETPAGKDAKGSYTVYALGTKADLSKANITFYSVTRDSTGKVVESSKQKVSKLPYTGNAIRFDGAKSPYIMEVTVGKGSSAKKVDETEYDVVYADNVNKGKATIMITAKTASTTYAGSKTAKITIAAQKLDSELLKDLFKSTTSNVNEILKTIFG